MFQIPAIEIAIYSINYSNNKGLSHAVTQVVYINFDAVYTHLHGMEDHCTIIMLSSSEWNLFQCCEWGVHILYNSKLNYLASLLDLKDQGRRQVGAWGC